MRSMVKFELSGGSLIFRVENYVDAGEFANGLVQDPDRLVFIFSVVSCGLIGFSSGADIIREIFSSMSF